MSTSTLNLQVSHSVTSVGVRCRFDSNSIDGEMDCFGAHGDFIFNVDSPFVPSSAYHISLYVAVKHRRVNNKQFHIKQKWLNFCDIFDGKLQVTFNFERIFSFKFIHSLQKIEECQRFHEKCSSKWIQPKNRYR